MIRKIVITVTIILTAMGNIMIIMIMMIVMIMNIMKIITKIRIVLIIR